MTASDSAPGVGSADWAGETSQRWAVHAERLEAMLAPVDGILLPAAAITAGERVLDVGCGRGVTTRAAATLAGPSGATAGIDISPTLITEAAALPPPPGSAPIDWVAADAAAHPFPQGTFDVVVSRFGAIFFDDPVAAFTHLGNATRPGGRLTLAVWQPQDASEFQWLSIDIAVRVAGDHGITLHPGPPAAGPFAYGTHDHTAPILEAAGWIDVTVDPHELPLYVGGAGTTPEQAVEMGRQVGPFGMLLRGAPTDVVDAVSVALVDEMHTRWDGTGVALPAAIAIVTARRP
ncbi:MAG TPA: class I SAM-dependent methyltransferase [Ilumatobacter sp.]|nr:class I SAM-dependent methyltransferase [Ilumatobacter sp.]